VTKYSYAINFAGCLSIIRDQFHINEQCVINIEVVSDNMCISEDSYSELLNYRNEIFNTHINDDLYEQITDGSFSEIPMKIGRYIQNINVDCIKKITNALFRSGDLFSKQNPFYHNNTSFFFPARSGFKTVYYIQNISQDKKSYYCCIPHENLLKKEEITIDMLKDFRTFVVDKYSITDDDLMRMKYIKKWIPIEFLHLFVDYDSSYNIQMEIADSMHYTTDN
jgi:hypothetical protein